MDRWIRRVVWGTVGLILALPVLWMAIVVAGALSRGYGWDQMDWNGDGRTTIGEFLQTEDVMTKEVVVEGRRCLRYLAMKDTMPLRTDCPPR